tara:strand:- start:68 stop:637 length:570 start_codon:yes stop_codon:yes gene_type:complete
MKRIFIFLGLFVMLFATSANTGGIDHSWVPTIYQPAIVEVEPEPVKMLLDPSELDCMAKNIYFEAAIESTAGKLAVAQVTMNRVRSSNYPDTICKVVKQGKHHANGFPMRDRCQFSWYCDGKHDTPFQGKMWQESINLAKYVMKTPSLIDVTDGATHYHANYIPDPRWADKNKKTVAIDTHIFYKIYSF